jgi:hypothetical protein
MMHGWLFVGKYRQCNCLMSCAHSVHRLFTFATCHVSDLRTQAAPRLHNSPTHARPTHSNNAGEFLLAKKTPAIPLKAVSLLSARGVSGICTAFRAVFAGHLLGTCWACPMGFILAKNNGKGWRPCLQAHANIAAEKSGITSSPATNHVYKHVRVLRRAIEALGSLTDSELLTLYPELRHVANRVSVLRQKRLKRIRDKTAK